MRVLHLIPSVDCGGAQRQLAYLVAALVREGIDTHVGSFWGGMHLERIADSGATFHRLHTASNYDPRNTLRVFTLLQNLKADLVQTWLPPMDIHGGVAAPLMRTPWIISERSSRGFYKGSWKFTLRRTLGQRAAAVASNSLTGLGYWSDCTGFVVRGCIPNIIPYEEIANAPTSPADCSVPLSQGQLIVVVARLVPGKNILRLLDALQMVLQRNDDVSVQIIGKGPLEHEVRQRIGQCAPRLNWLKESHEVWSWLKFADVYVSASLEEGSPNSVLEAMQCGCALVLSDIAAHREVASASRAILVSARDSRAIAAGIEKALACDVAREDRIPSPCDRHRADQVGRSYVALYDEVLHLAAR